MTVNLKREKPTGNKYLISDFYFVVSIEYDTEIDNFKLTRSELKGPKIKTDSDGYWIEKII